MTWPHSPWPLFCNDLDLARTWLKPQIQGVVPRRTGHLAISLGLGTELLEGVQSGTLQTDPNSLYQWRFRLARLRKEANPYRHLLADGLLEQIIAALTSVKLGRHTLGVELNGGIGDHLEALSMIIPWAQSCNAQLDLVMSEERQHQIEPIISKHKNLRCITRSESKPNPIPVMALRAGLTEEANLTHYSPWISPLNARHGDDHRYLCCWRAEGFGDKFSAHSRSVAWTMVHNFYKKVKRLDHKACIVDITCWTRWESQKLQAMGVSVIDPRDGSLLDLIKRCHSSRVITIDTALAHLCAASGIEADVLLCLFPDERWQELHKPENNYGQFLKPRRSCHFGDWSAVLSSLTASLASAA